MEKKRSFHGKSLWKSKLIKVMKLTVFLMLISLMGVFASETYSQTTRLTVNANKMSLEDFLVKIENQSEFRFFYTGKIDVEQEVSGEFRNKKIFDIFDEIKKEAGFQYEVLGHQIILSPNNAEGAIKSIQQQKSVSGNVTDTRNQPLPGVTVVVKGTATGTVTNTDGNYTLSNIQDNAVLQFSFVGMKTQAINVGYQTTINVKLEEEAFGIEEVVTVGYGTQKRETITGALSAIKGDEIVQSSSVNISNSLAGRSSGVISVSNSGDPGNDASNLLIRGINSFGGGTAPLIVVDGIADRDMNRLNPVDIESVTVLKDASAAIYGVRSANGVILITTKRGSGENKVDYDFNYGMQQYTRRRPINTSSLEYMQYMNEAFINEGNAVPFPPELLTKYNTLNTDWYKETFRSVAPQMQHRLSVSGGSDRINYFVSGQYLEQQSNYRVSDKVFKQFNLRSNIDAKVSKNIILTQLAHKAIP